MYCLLTSKNFAAQGSLSVVDVLHHQLTESLELFCLVSAGTKAREHLSSKDEKLRKREEIINSNISLSRGSTDARSGYSSVWTSPTGRERWFGRWNRSAASCCSVRAQSLRRLAGRWRFLLLVLLLEVLFPRGTATEITRFDSIWLNLHFLRSKTPFQLVSVTQIEML